MPRPMPSMFTTLTEKIDTSPSTVAPTRTARVVMTPPMATSIGMPPATSPPSRTTMAMMAMGRAIASPFRRSLSDAVAKVSLTSTLPPTSTSGASSSWARSSTCCARRAVVLVEVAGEGDDDERGAPVGGPQGVGPGRPGIGHVEDTSSAAICAEPGGEVALHLRVVDIDVVGHDGDLPTGLGEVVELLGHATGLGGGAGAEVGRQHRERRAADGGGRDQQPEPREDDGAPMAHHEASEPALRRPLDRLLARPLDGGRVRLSSGTCPSLERAVVPAGADGAGRHDVSLTLGTPDGLALSAKRQGGVQARCMNPDGVDALIRSAIGGDIDAGS